jgi:hypothetical protein
MQIYCMYIINKIKIKPQICLKFHIYFERFEYFRFNRL